MIAWVLCRRCGYVNNPGAVMCQFCEEDVNAPICTECGESVDVCICNDGCEVCEANGCNGNDECPF